jgi:hypothetical protein
MTIDPEVQAFREWLAGKPPDGTYDYCSNTSCCFAQFLKETGLSEQPYVGISEWGHSPISLRYVIPYAIRTAFTYTLNGRRGCKECTFGDTLRHLDRLIAEGVD